MQFPEPRSSQNDFGHAIPRSNPRQCLLLIGLDLRKLPYWLGGLTARVTPAEKPVGTLRPPAAARDQAERQVGTAKRSNIFKTAFLAIEAPSFAISRVKRHFNRRGESNTWRVAKDNSAFFVGSPLKKPPGEGTGPAAHADS